MNEMTGDDGLPAEHGRARRSRASVRLHSGSGHAALRPRWHLELSMFRKYVEELATDNHP
jgi:hypothetical protein